MPDDTNDTKGLEPEEPEETLNNDADEAAPVPSPEEDNAQAGMDEVHKATFETLKAEEGKGKPIDIDYLLDIGMDLSIELGRSKLNFREVLALKEGAVVELDRLAGDPVDLFVNKKLIARGEVVVIDDNFGVRVTEILSPAELLNNLKEK